MIVFVSTACVAAIAFAGLLVRWTHGEFNAPLPLAAMPVAALFVALPVPLLSFDTIHRFQQLGRAQEGVVNEAVRLCLNLDHVLWLGVAAFLATLGMCVILERLVVPHAPTAADAPTPTPQRPPWRGWILVASSMTVPFAGVLLQLLQPIPRILLSHQLRPGGAILLSPAELSEISRTVATRLVAGVLGGVPVSIVVLGFVAANVWVIRAPVRTPPLVRYGLVAGAVAALLGLVAAVRLSVDIRWLESGLR